MFDNDSFSRKAFEWFFFNEGLSLDYVLYWLSPKLGVTPMQVELDTYRRENLFPRKSTNLISIDIKFVSADRNSDIC